MVKRRNRIYKQSKLPYEIVAYKIIYTKKGIISSGPLYRPNCKRCGKEVPGLRSAGEMNRQIKKNGAIYCSNMCVRGKDENKRLCKICNKEFRGCNISGKDRENRYKYCSKQCYTKWQKTEENCKENNPNWKGGYSYDERHSPKARDWRLRIFERDNYRCAKCNKLGGNLNAHHIRTWVEYPELRYEITNGITLCKRCHTEVHSNKDPKFLILKLNEAKLLHR